LSLHAASDARVMDSRWIKMTRSALAIVWLGASPF
jgi:hypothetical protein